MVTTDSNAHSDRRLGQYKSCFFVVVLFHTYKIYNTGVKKRLDQK